MTRQQIKIEIEKILDQIPEDKVREVYEYLKSISQSSPEAIAKANHLKTILQEDSELLKKLAQ